MRASVLLSTLLASALFVATSAHAQAGAAETEGAQFTLDATVSVATGLGYEDQAFTPSNETVTELELDGRGENFGFAIWHAEDSSGPLETDFTLKAFTETGNVTFGADLGYYLVPESAEIWEAKLYVTRPISESCKGTLSGEIMRGGYETEVARGEVACDFEVSEGLYLDGFVSASYDTSIEASSIGYNVGVTREFDRFWVRGFIRGYQSEVGDDSFVGASVGKTF